MYGCGYTKTSLPPPGVGEMMMCMNRFNHNEAENKNPPEKQKSIADNLDVFGFAQLGPDYFLYFHIVFIVLNYFGQGLGRRGG